jgi:hypothetical protein
MRYIRVAALTLAAASLANVSAAAPIFSDNFNTAASLGNYTIITTDATSSYATSGYDYSAFGIPSAPHSGDSSTLGLRLDANNSVAPNAAEAVTLATNAQYSDSYVVTFDAWINVNGPFPDGGSGSTNYLTAGVGSNGTTNNFVANTGSGTWTAVNGENGSGVDYRLYKAGSLQPAGSQYSAPGGTRDGTNAYYSQFGNVDITNFPVQGSASGGPAQQNGTSGPGTFGMAWHQVRLEVAGGVMSWTIDNLPIGTLTPASAGSVAIGYSDPTANASDLRNYSFALIDNLVIVPEPATLTLCLASLFALGLLPRRR